MEKTSPTRFRWPHLVVPVLSLLAVMLLAAYIVLPLAAERLLLPLVFQAVGIPAYDLPVRRVGLFGMDLGTLRIGPEAAPGISVVSLSVTYTPADLLKRRASLVTIEGARVLVREMPDGGFEIPGLPISAAGAEGREASFSEPIPFIIPQIDIRQGEIVVQRGDQLLRLPFEATITSESNMTALEAKIRLALADRWMAVRTYIDLAENRLSADWDGRGIRPAVLANMAGLGKGLALSGSGQSIGRLKGRVFPFQPESVEMTFRHTPCRLNWGDVRLDLSGATPSEDMGVTITRQGMDPWEIETTPMRMALSSADGLFTLTGSLGRNQAGDMTWQGHLAAMVSADLGKTGLPILMLPLELQTSATVSADGRWQARVTHADGDRPERKATLDLHQASVRLALAELEASVEGHREAFDANIQWRLPALDVVYDDLNLKVGTGEGVGHYRQTGNDGKGSATLTLGAIAVQNRETSTRVQTVQLTGEGTFGDGMPPRYSGLVSVAGGAAETKAAPVKVSGLRVRLPVVWPPQKGQEGNFTLASATWQDKTLGSVSGRLRQTLEGVAIQIDHDSGFVPGLKVKADGAAGLTQGTNAPFARIDWTANRPAQAPPLPLSDLMPEPPEIPITFSGRLFAQGGMTYDGEFSASLTAGIEDGRLQVDEDGMIVEGIQTALHIPDLKQIRSAPRQTLTFDAASFGAIRAEDGKLAFQIEPGNVFFLEGGRFRWCGGTVIAPATRFVPGVNQYDVAVYCDRLKLDQVLEQLGMARVEGGGAISGLIPVVLADGLVTFNNAFLYSTPGERSVIRVQGSEVLTAGIPPGTPQYNQMELARYALKDYDYEWAKITMNTVADDLLVQLQFDGKPAEPLPFVYTPETGGFVKTAPGKPGSVFQGIRLDVNVTLPLNRMLRYREFFN
ncbi:MAG: YdbH domain-containing protein [Deltaproteobacteria bacterium]|nr:YdbH domain-containing protein [Deltaproteobacteria bacterium]